MRELLYEFDKLMILKMIAFLFCRSYQQHQLFNVR